MSKLNDIYCRLLATYERHARVVLRYYYAIIFRFVLCSTVRSLVISGDSEQRDTTGVRWTNNE